MKNNIRDGRRVYYSDNNTLPRRFLPVKTQAFVTPGLLIRQLRRHVRLMSTPQMKGWIREGVLRSYSLAGRGLCNNWRGSAILAPTGCGKRGYRFGRTRQSTMIFLALNRSKTDGMRT